MRKSFYKVILCLAIVIPFGNEIKAQITATIDANNTWCNLNNGTAEIYPSGGIAGAYTYKWSNGGSTTDTITGLAPGSYTVTAYFGTDSVVKAFNIAGSIVPTITVTASHDSICLGTPDQLIASSTPAVPQYIWSGGTLTAPDTAISINVTTISAGNVTFTVTLGAGCPASGTFVLSAYPVTASLVSTVQPTCGLNNGQIICSSTSTNTINTFLKNGSVTQSGSSTQLDSAGPGSYTFIIYDPPTGCSDTTPNPIVLTDNSTFPIFSNVQVTADSCFGKNTGAIAVTVGNCTSGCTYGWSQSTTNTTTSATGLPAGIDTFYVSSSGCPAMDTAITVPGPMAALTDSVITYPDHCDKSLGSALALTTGGTGPYTYVWSAGNPLGDSVTGLAGHTEVAVTVTDSYGCSAVDSASVGNTPGPVAFITPSDTICATESNGILIVTPVSGQGAFSYLWSNGQTTNVDAGLPPGLYSVTVSDVGCDTVLQATVPAYQPHLSLAAIPGSTVDAGQQMEIQLSTNVPFTNIVWDPYINASLGSTVVGFQAEQTTQYTVTVSYGLACQISETILVTVLTDTTKWSIPNTFTPNNDHLNDEFKLISYPPLSVFHIWIYDRWGNKVYDSTDPEFQWNGTDHYSGNGALNTGVFAYVIQYQELNSDTKRTIGGNISLIK